MALFMNSLKQGMMSAPKMFSLVAKTHLTKPALSLTMKSPTLSSVHKLNNPNLTRTFSFTPPNKPISNSEKHHYPDFQEAPNPMDPHESLSPALEAELQELDAVSTCMWIGLIGHLADPFHLAGGKEGDVLKKGAESKDHK